MVNLRRCQACIRLSNTELKRRQAAARRAAAAAGKGSATAHAPDPHDLAGGGASGHGGLDAAGAAAGGDEDMSECCVAGWELTYDVVFAGCGHMSLCGTCAAAIDSCPICRVVSPKVKVFRA